MLTREQKKAIVSYLTGWSTKPIFEDVDEIGQTWTEENSDQLEDEVGNFLDECAAVLEEWVKNE